MQMSPLGLRFQFVSFFLSCHKSLCANKTQEPHLQHLMSQNDEFLDRVFVMTQVSNVDLPKKRFPVVQVDSMCQVASICRSLAKRVDLESLLVDWKRVKIVHKNSTLPRENSPGSFK